MGLCGENKSTKSQVLVGSKGRHPDATKVDYKAPLAFDFIVEYKKGSESRVTDSLSRKVQEGEGALMLISFPSVDWVEKLRMAYEDDSQLKRLLVQCTTGRLGSNYTLRD